MTSRRRFLMGSAAALFAAPFMNLLDAPRAHAAGGAKRLLVFFSPNGTVHRHWRPTGSGSDYQFGTGSMLEPLAGLESKLTVIEGLDFYGASNHEGGMAAMLTNGGGSGTVTGGRSLDQFVADEIGGGTRFRSVELGALTSVWGGGQQTRMSYTGPGKFVTPNDDPLDAFTRMFGDISGGAEGAQAQFERRRSVLDIANDELGDLQSRLSVAERAKLQIHLDSLRTLERQLEPSAGTCDPLSAPERIDPKANDRFPDIARLQMDLAVQALACGLTNVASVQLSHTVSPVSFTWLGISDGHHSLSHAGDGTAGVDRFVECERWVAQQFAYLVDRLDSLPDPDGDGTMLDNTVVLWAKEMGDSRAHVCTNVPFILAGGGGAYRTGRYLKVGGKSHAHLLVSICQALGLGNDTFGDPAAGAGPLTELS